MENETIKQLNVRMPQQTLDDLKALASIAGKSINNIVVNILNRNIAQYREIIDSRNKILETLKIENNFDLDDENSNEINTTKELAREICNQTNKVEVEQKLPICEHTEEVWKPIAGRWYNYQISNFGRVKDKKGKILSKHIQGKSVRVSVSDHNGCSNITVAREVLKNFSDMPDGKGVRIIYNDGNFGNVRLDNLRYEFIECVNTNNESVNSVSTNNITEIWKPLSNKLYSSYSVSNFGRVKGPSGLISTYMPKGGINYRFSVSGKRGKATTLILAFEILRSFVGAPPGGGKRVRFKDGNRSNLRLDNLEWES